MPSTFFRPVTLIREAPGSYGADGIYVPGALTTSTINASVQPMSLQLFQMVQNEHAGLRFDGTRRIYTETQLRVGDKRSANGATVTNGDIIQLPAPDGRKYRIIGVQEWQVGSTIDYYEYTAALMQPDPP